MIVLEIANASDLVASKLGDFAERLTPDFLDDHTVEDLVIKRMIENLSHEGVKGQISSLKGAVIRDNQMILKDGFRVRNQKSF